MKISKYFSDKNNTFMPSRSNPDVIKSSKGKIHRERVLKAAVALGLIRNQESSLEFIDDSGRNRMIISKIVKVSDEHAFLQNNKSIPIRKISNVLV